MLTSIFNEYNNGMRLLSQDREQKTTINVLAGRVDFEKTFESTIKWELGTSGTHAFSSGYSHIVNFNSSEAVNALFSYDEKNYAAYTQLSGKRKKNSYSAGLRMENTNVMTAMLNTIKDSAAVTGKSKPFVYFYSSNEFRLPKKYTFTVSGWAITKSYQGAFERNALFAVDTSVTKTLFKNLNCSVRFNNMFRSVNREEKFAINDVAANGIYHDNSREFSIALK
jgi:hypothetical protein